MKKLSAADDLSETEKATIKDVLYECEEIILELEENYSNSPYIELMKRLQSVLGMLDEDGHEKAHRILKKLQVYFQQMHEDDFSTREVVDHILKAFDDIKGLFEQKNNQFVSDSETTLARLKRITDGQKKVREEKNIVRLEKKALSIKDLVIYHLDDDPDFLDTMKFEIEEIGCRVKGATKKEELKAMIFSSFPDLVLIDNKLADQTGVSIVRALTKLIPGLPCVLVTGNLDEEVLNKSLEAGAVTAISKPVERRNLERVLNAAILKKNHYRYMNSVYRFLGLLERTARSNPSLSTQLKEGPEDLDERLRNLIKRGEILGLK